MRVMTGCVLIGIAAWAAGADSQTAPAGRNASPLEIREGGKSVAEYPQPADLSTPEAAYATIARILAGGEEGTWQRVSTKELADRLPPENAPRRDVSADEAQAWLNARIIEVRVFRGRFAGVIARHVRPSGAVEIDLRCLEFQEGRWFNTGQEIAPSVEEARRRFALGCGRYAVTPPQPRIENAEAHLARFTESLNAKAEEPARLVMRALAEHRLLILGEVHHRPRYWAFNSGLVADPRFPDIVGTIYMELPSNDQAKVDAFLAARELDTQPVIETLRDNLWMGWPDQAMLDFFVTVWKVNRGLAPSRRLQIVLVDMQRPWKDIHAREEWKRYETDRDRLMAENIVRDLRERPSDRRHGLFIVGVGHAMLNLKYPDETTPMNSAGRHLRRELGADAVYAVFPHMPVQTNWGRVDGRLCRGLFDSAFARMQNRPIALPLAEGPFGEQPFDAFPDQPAVGTYRDGYDAYLCLGPLEDEVFSPLIPGFYTDEFVKELDRRHQMMFGRSLVEGCRLPRLDAESFVRWMSRDWGRPRRSWKEGLGPIDAWRSGSGPAQAASRPSTQ